MSATVLEGHGTAGVVGTRMLRREDPALLSGEARFVHDLVVPGALHMAVVRSPYAHARITSVDVSVALGMPGVVAALTGADLAGEWASPMPCAWPVTADMQSPEHLPVALREACYVGDAVAVVLAGSQAEAQDAAAAVAVDYEELPAAVDLEDAARDGVLAHLDAPSNRAYTWELIPDPEAVRRAFDDAAVTVKERYVQQRLIPAAMEPRGVCVVPQPFGGEYVVYSSTQIPHILRTMLGMTAGVPEERIRVIAPSVGGGFGSKLDVYAEELLCLALARRLRRPVRWSEERSEAAQATIHGRGQVQDIELAADADGRVKAVRVHLLADMGAYLQLVTPGVPILGAFLYHGTYDVPAYSFTCTGVFTNKTPTDAYRGAGRPEATYAIERAMDALARKLGMDPAELRRRNFIGADKFPYSSVAGLVFDSGDYEAALDKALGLVGYEALRQEQAQRRSDGATKLLGVGLSSYVEMCGLAPSRVLASLHYVAGGWETATVRMLPTGKVQVVTGATPHGQGHVTSWSMIVADKLGVPPDDVEVLHSDTGLSPLGLDTYGSRSLSVGGTAIALAADRLVDKARLLAAYRLEAAPEDLELSDGQFAVRGTPSTGIGIGTLAFEAFTAHDLPEGMEPNLEASATYDPTNFTFPFGTHVAVVEVDTETGRVDLVRYVGVDDCGNQINPLIVDGQVHGGIAQGVAQALYEEASYDERGNLLTTTLADYLVPAASDLPSFTLGRTVTPSPSNPLGVKGVGEAGTIASTPAVVNAVVDALSHLGVEDLEMPVTPERVWRSIGAAAPVPGGAR
ncbi:MAG: xanthine dehydrogenase family protein molybdopterin-binding subunit [Actinomycetota bacterium]|nr:xanthine dehydrogenase family protein molybdopterin-binding subunit [Actinomycetota bacterium]MDA8313582.1 xanthine dehydrogenase family protein molybdopterin-binding subunit [Actinomycetota bacterium]